MKRYIHLIIALVTASLILWSCNKSNNTTSNGFHSGTNTGTGGSLARFIVVSDYLYVVDDRILKTYQLINNGKPILTHSVEIGFNIETIFNFGNKLFIGSQSAMYIYDISAPATPTYESSATHLRACDPVVANQQNAYVTVRSSFNNASACGGNTNALLVYDITNIANPVLLNTVELYNPNGLALYRNTLYVCDGTEGLRIFNLEKSPSEPVLTQTITVSDGNIYFDCIAKDGYLYTMMKNGFIIYDISNPQEPIMLGKMLH
jgi:hypothetical protein